MTVVNVVEGNGLTVPITVPDRGGTSPIGTSSPNSGTTAATNTSYSSGAFTSGVGVASANAYTVQNTDYQGTIQFTASGAIAVTLNSAVNQNFTCTLLNLGSGVITLTPTLGYLVNGAASLTLPVSAGCQVSFANRAWTVFVGVTALQIVPGNTPPVSHEWIKSYNSTTGAFTQTQPDYSDLTGTPTLPANTPATTGEYLTAYNSTTGAFTKSTPAGISATITTAALTALGTQGSMTFVDGRLTAQTPAT